MERHVTSYLRGEFHLGPDIIIHARNTDNLSVILTAQVNHVLKLIGSSLHGLSRSFNKAVRIKNSGRKPQHFKSDSVELGFFVLRDKTVIDQRMKKTVCRT